LLGWFSNVYENSDLSCSLPSIILSSFLNYQNAFTQMKALSNIFYPIWMCFLIPLGIHEKSRISGSLKFVIACHVLYFPIF
jgi:hypothetical protein